MVTKRISFSILVLGVMVVLVGGAVGATVDVEQLEKEVILLTHLTQLNLTGEQIDLIIPKLKDIQAIISRTRLENENLLIQEKELLLAGKREEVKELQNSRDVLNNKTGLEIRGILLDLQLILNEEQQNMIGNLIVEPERPGMGRIIINRNGKWDKGRVHLPGVPVSQKKTLVPMEVPLALEGKYQQYVQKKIELKEKARNASQEESDAIRKEMEELDSDFRELLKGLNQGVSGRQFIRGQIVGFRHSGTFNPRGWGFCRNEEGLSLLIKVLEEMRGAL